MRQLNMRSILWTSLLFTLIMLQICHESGAAITTTTPEPSTLCMSQGSIRQLEFSFVCDCFPGFNGSFCEIDIDECIGVVCPNGLCIDGANSYTCSCNAGWTGASCQEDVDECASSPCDHGNCTNEFNNYTCTCDENYEGYDCDIFTPCKSISCENGGICTDDAGSYKCICVPGYTGHLCGTDIDECSPNPCHNGGSCTDKVNSYKCSCQPGYTGQQCKVDIDDCATTPCEHGGTCTDKVNGYECSCVNGTTGTRCETNINDCTVNSCSNGACIDELNGYSCDCTPGYTGNNCDTDIDDCQPGPCQRGSCMDQVNAYKCSCPSGYTGMNCETYGLCEPSPCEHGDCKDDGNNHFDCVCYPGYNGTLCKNDIDECASNPCKNGICNQSIANFSCTCDAGFEGYTCEHNIDDCMANPCQNGATCIDGIDSYNCICAYGYGGINCSTALPCGDGICENGGTCSGLQVNFTCACRRGFNGDRCESCSWNLNAWNGTFASPDIPSTSTNTYECSWNVTVDMGYAVELVLDVADRSALSGNTTDFIDVKAFKSLEGYNLLERIRNKGDRKYLAPEQTVTLDFSTDLGLPHGLTFNARFKAVPVTTSPDCGKQLYGQTGSISSPPYAASYWNNLYCSWIITFCSGHDLWIKYDTQGMDDTDHFIVLEIMPDINNLLLSVTGQKQTGEMWFNKSSLLVEFHTNGKKRNKAMTFEYIIHNNCTDEYCASGYGYCKNNGTCVEDSHGLMCICKEGYNGTTCEYTEVETKMPVNSTFNLESMRVDKKTTNIWKRKFRTVPIDIHDTTSNTIGILFLTPVVLGYITIVMFDIIKYRRHALYGPEADFQNSQTINK